MENRNGLVLDVELTQATGRAERKAALRMLDRLNWTSRTRPRISRWSLAFRASASSTAVNSWISYSGREEGFAES
jgi:hypothetical protein